MKRSLQGRYVAISTTGETARAFIPSPLPPEPPIDWTPSLREKFDRALLALGDLNGMSEFLPDASLLLYTYIRKEAVLSSMIEGTQSSLSDLLLFEIDQVPGVPLADVQEVSNYVAALNFGIDRLNNGFPLSLRLIKEMHSILLSKGRGSSKCPGEFRHSQNWIGGSRPGNAAFVPPPPENLMDCMGALELFLHDQPIQTAALLKAALAHVQFETIHPFLDGNGRLGRLLITLIFIEQKILQKPMLYLSLYFKTHRTYYYELLNNVRLNGDWEAWLEFFAEAVIFTAGQAVEMARQLDALAKHDNMQIILLAGKQEDSLTRLHSVLKKHPLCTAGFLVEQTALTPATVNRGLKSLGQLGITSEITSRKRNRIFSYTKYIDIINQGTELPD